MSMRIVKPGTPAEKRTGTTMDTMELTQKRVKSWKLPLFQRPLKINSKVLEVAAEIQRNGGVVPGILTIGVLDDETYLVDGQHRIAAWLQTGSEVGYADVRTHWFENQGDMAKEFVRLNSALVRLKPDDILRGLEPSSEALQRIRKKCPFVGYDMIRKSERTPMVSMSTFIRMWSGSRGEVPTTGNSSAVAILDGMSMDDVESLIEFGNLCIETWHRDFAYFRLWSSLNLTLCAWLYRRIVLGEGVTKQMRTAHLTREQFRKGLMALSADGQYLDYLVGRNLGERDRAPAYGRLKAIFQRRHLDDTGKAIKLPMPAWSHA